jgi:hypothetical protein
MPTGRVAHAQRENWWAGESNTYHEGRNTEMMATDPNAARLRKTELVMRITQRVIRAWRLGEWALLRQVNPDGSSTEPNPEPFMPDEGSSLALDDEGFTPHIGNHVVSSTARFPMMSAAENLVGAGQAHAAALQQGRLSTTSVAALCRCAIESSAKTIWLLSETSRDVRRARCLGFLGQEREPQKGFINIEERYFGIRDDPSTASDYQNFQRHRHDYECRDKLINALPKKERHKPPGTYELFVKCSGEWIDANPPPHANSELPLGGMALGAQRFYSFGSSFVHGYKWMTDYVKGDLETLRIVAESFTAAVIMTECAVALLEAQSGTADTAVTRRKNYPKWLEPTVAAWSPRYR